MHDWVFIDFFVVLLLCMLLVLVLTIKKMHDLLRLDYTLHETGVPERVVRLVQAAESYYYSQSKTNKSIEAIEDLLALIAPQIVYWFNFSVGRMRMKPKTMESVIHWAVQHKMLTLNMEETPRLAYLLAYLAMIPNVCRWQAEVYLAKLKSEHPQLADIDWSEIAEKPSLIAKLYSGYMGAGGDWEGWKQTLEPGKEARRRFKYSGAQDSYQLYEELK